MLDRYVSPDPADEQSLDIFRFLQQKLANQGDVVIGMHGTSAAIARQIEKDGLQNYRCVEGYYGVWFADDSVPSLAETHGTRKALKQGDSSYAVITAQLKYPQPDTKGRKQWLADASNTQVLKVEYYEIDE